MIYKTPKNTFKQRQRIILLIKKGVSIPKISKELGVAKSTIYYHYKKIKGRKNQLVTIPDEDTILGEFLGAFAGDGSFFFDKKGYHYNIRIHLGKENDQEYAKYLKKLIEENFNKKVNVYQDKSRLILYFSSKRIYDLICKHLIIKRIKTYNVALKKPIKSYSKDFIFSFARGLYDTDGHISKGGIIKIKLTSKKIIQQLSIILKIAGIENKISFPKIKNNEHPIYKIDFSKKMNHIFSRKINFSNIRKRIRLEKDAASGNRTAVTPAGGRIKYGIAFAIRTKNV